MSKSKKSWEMLILSKDMPERLGLKTSRRLNVGRRRSKQESVPLIELSGPQ